MERGILFVLGVAAVVVAPPLGRFFGHPLFYLAGVLGVAVVAGLVEAASVRRTGTRQWMWSWLPAAAGMAVVVAYEIVRYSTSTPRAPDGGVAVSILVFTSVVGIPAFAVLVNGVAAAAIRLTSRDATRADR